MPSTQIWRNQSFIVIISSRDMIRYFFFLLRNCNQNSQNEEYEILAVIGMAWNNHGIQWCVFGDRKFSMLLVKKKKILHFYWILFPFCSEVARSLYFIIRNIIRSLNHRGKRIQEIEFLVHVRCDCTTLFNKKMIF